MSDVRLVRSDTVMVEITDRLGKISQIAFLSTSVLLCNNVQMDYFKKVFYFYGKFILNTHWEVLYEELMNYTEYRKDILLTFGDVTTTTRINSNRWIDCVVCSSVCTFMVDILMTTPTRFVNIRKLMRITATLPLTFVLLFQHHENSEVAAVLNNGRRTTERFSGWIAIKKQKFILKKWSTTLLSARENWTLPC